MKPIEQLKSILSNEYESEDGDKYKVQLLDGMSDKEIEELKSKLPKNNLPNEIEELLRFARGFEFWGIDEIRFDTFGNFGFEEYFPKSVELAGDGFGNFWILDVNDNGEWKEVYYVCHDPPAIVKHSNNLGDFIKDIDLFGRLGRESNLDIIHEKIVGDIWNEKISIMEQNENDYEFPQEITNQLPEIFMVADLTNKPIRTGFNWAKYGVNSKVIRFQDKPIWIMEKKVKQGFLSRLFNRKKN